MKITERDNRPPGDYDREKWRRLVERFEWLEEHCWVLPPEERWDAMKRSRTKIVGLVKERAWTMAAASVTPGHG
jgi:hypothetical protein